MKNFEPIKGHVWLLGFNAVTKSFCWSRVGALMEHELIGVAVQTHPINSSPADTSILRSPSSFLPSPANPQPRTQ